MLNRETYQKIINIKSKLEETKALEKFKNVVKSFNKLLRILYIASIACLVFLLTPLLPFIIPTVLYNTDITTGNIITNKKYTLIKYDTFSGNWHYSTLSKLTFVTGIVAISLGFVSLVLLPIIPLVLSSFVIGLGIIATTVSSLDIISQHSIKNTTCEILEKGIIQNIINSNDIGQMKILQKDIQDLIYSPEVFFLNLYKEIEKNGKMQYNIDTTVDNITTSTLNKRGIDNQSPIIL